ncbi:MAG: hypothetical protein Q9195_003259 [Heterodermia aff. obscurata]
MSMQDVNLAPGNNNEPIKSTGAEGGDSVQTLGGGKVADTPSIGSGTGSSGARREEELKAGLEEKEELEQGGGS